MACRVEVQDPGAFIDLSPDLNAIRTEIAQRRDLGPNSPMHYLGPSPRLTPNSEISAFAAGQVLSSDSAASTAVRLGRALHDEITFDATATTVDTDPLEAFRLRRGVCQDISHIMIIGLRSLGIPAAYVSGYLRTLPPEGGVRLEGADAMHAWVSAWCGANQGWIEYDPTNATLVGADHIVVGYGRDYGDVSPVIGHLRASGGQRSSQSVDVAPAH
ncbi:transglutaminase-like domain-containing protein [Algicella marina]